MNAEAVTGKKDRGFGKVGLAIGIAALVVAGIGLWSMISKVSDVKISSLVPENAVIYLSRKDIQKHWDSLENTNFYKSLTQEEVWQEYVVKNLEQAKKRFKEEVGVALSKENIMQLVGKEVVIAIFKSEAGSEIPFNVMLFARAGAKAKLYNLVVKSADKLGEEKLEVYKYKKVEISHLKSEPLDAPNLRYAFLDDILVITAGMKDETNLERVIDLYLGDAKNSLSVKDEFKEVTSKLPGGEVGLFYLNAKEFPGFLQNMLSSIPTPAQGKKVSFSNLTAGWEPLKAIASATYGMVGRSYTLVDRSKADKNLLKLWEVKSKESASLKFTPSGTFVYGSGHTNMQAYWQYLKDTMAKQSQESASAITKYLESIKTVSGLDVEKDIIPWIGDEIGYFISEVNLEGPFPLPKISFLIETKDETKAKNVLEKVKELISAKSRNAQGTQEMTPPQLQFETKDHKGVAIISLSLPMMGKGLSPSYAFVDNFLIISSSSPLLERMVDVYQGKSDSLKADARFKKATSLFAKKNNSLIYADTEKGLELVKEIINLVTSMKQTEAVLEIKLQVFPMLDYLKAIKSFSASTTAGGMEGISYIRIEDFPKIQPPKTTVPKTTKSSQDNKVESPFSALSRAREMVKITRDRSNLRQIGLGIHMYAQDNNEKFPNTLSDLYPKYISTLDVLKCPAQKEKIKTKADIDTKAGYKYISGLSEESPPSAVVAHTKKGYFKRGRNILYVDGHVEWEKDTKLE